MKLVVQAATAATTLLIVNLVANLDTITVHPVFD